MFVYSEETALLDLHDESLESPLSLSDDDLFRFLDLRVSFLLFFFFSFLLFG